MEIERAVRGSGDARLRAKFVAAIYTIRRALALYPYVLSPSPFFSAFPALLHHGPSMLARFLSL